MERIINSTKPISSYCKYSIVCQMKNYRANVRGTTRKVLKTNVDFQRKPSDVIHLVSNIIDFCCNGKET